MFGITDVASPHERLRAAVRTLPLAEWAALAELVHATDFRLSQFAQHGETGAWSRNQLVMLAQAVRFRQAHGRLPSPEELGPLVAGRLEAEHVEVGYVKHGEDPRPVVARYPFMRV